MGSPVKHFEDSKYTVDISDIKESTWGNLTLLLLLLDTKSSTKG